VQRWLDEATTCDAVLLDFCNGATLDVGCGPGRLTRALADRGHDVLGIDLSAEAVRIALSRGVQAMQSDVFAPQPREGDWASVLLADGNIGIGGDPVALLRRCAELLAPGGGVVVEVEPPGSGVTSGRVEVAADGLHGSLPWATVAADALDTIAEQAGLAVHRRGSTQSHRHVAELVRAGRAT
jgi:SAM-dependent methyltransferase